MTPASEGKRSTSLSPSPTPLALMVKPIFGGALDVGRMMAEQRFLVVLDVARERVAAAAEREPGDSRDVALVAVAEHQPAPGASARDGFRAAPPRVAEVMKDPHQQHAVEQAVRKRQLGDAGLVVDTAAP